MELITYSEENNDNFWISIGYNICKLRIDFDRIYTNIGEYNFYETNRMRQLVFYYIQPDRILSRLITHLSRVMRRLEYSSSIQYGEITIPSESIYFDMLSDYTYTKKYNSTKKKKSITNEDLKFINETFDNFEKLLNYIANENKFKKTSIEDKNDLFQLTKLEQIVRKLQNIIYRLKKYILEIPIREYSDK